MPGVGLHPLLVIPFRQLRPQNHWGSQSSSSHPLLAFQSVSPEGWFDPSRVQQIQGTALATAYL